MRKSAAILLLMVFVLSQYGHLMQYQYCVWASSINGNTTCDCVRILDLDNAQKDPLSASSRIVFHLKTEQDYVGESYTCSIAKHQPERTFSIFKDHLIPHSFTVSVWQPPDLA